MIQSKQNFFAIGWFVVMIIINLLAIFAMIEEVLVTSKTSVLGWGIVVGLFATLLMIFLFFVKTTQNISVEHDKITYANWLTGRIKVYFLKDLDGYMAIIRRSNFKEYQSILLVNEKKRMGEISNFSYSNYDELTSGIKNELKCLRQEEDFNLVESIKCKFND